MKIKEFAKAEAIDTLLSIAEKAFGNTADSKIDEWFSFGEMSKAISEHRGVCLIAEDDEGEQVGFVYAQQESPINGKEGLEKWVIVITAVVPESSGLGVGSALLKAIELQAAQQMAKKIFVYTNENDLEVINFYKKNGYEEAGKIKGYQYGTNNTPVFLLKYLNS